VLLAVGLVAVLVAPVQGHDDDLGAALAGDAGVGDDAGFVDEVRSPRLSPPGAGMRLNPRMSETRATSTPSTSSSVVAAASGGVRAEPPRSYVWLEAVVQ